MGGLPEDHFLLLFDDPSFYFLNEGSGSLQVGFELFEARVMGSARGLHVLWVVEFTESGTCLLGRKVGGWVGGWMS